MFSYSTSPGNCVQFWKIMIIHPTNCSSSVSWVEASIWIYTEQLYVFSHCPCTFRYEFMVSLDSSNITYSYIATWLYRPRGKKFVSHTHSHKYVDSLCCIALCAKSNFWLFFFFFFFSPYLYVWNIFYALYPRESLLSILWYHPYSQNLTSLFFLVFFFFFVAKNQAFPKLVLQLY